MADAAGERLGPISGRAGAVTVTLTDLTFRASDGGRRFAYPGFGSDLIEALHKALVGPRRRGLLRSTLVCPSCDTRLEGLQHEQVMVTTEVVLKRVPPIAVDVDMPGVTCPGCRRPLVLIDDRAVASELSDALIDAFKSAGILPG